MNEKKRGASLSPTHTLSPPFARMADATHTPMLLGVAAGRAAGAVLALAVAAVVFTAYPIGRAAALWAALEAAYFLHYRTRLVSMGDGFGLGTGCGRRCGGFLGAAGR